MFIYKRVCMYGKYINYMCKSHVFYMEEFIIVQLSNLNVFMSGSDAFFLTQEALTGCSSFHGDTAHENTRSCLCQLLLVWRFSN